MPVYSINDIRPSGKCNKENLEKLKKLIENRYEELKVQRVQVNYAWRSLAMRLSIKDTNDSFMVNSQIDKLRDLDTEIVCNRTSLDTEEIVSLDQTVQSAQTVIYRFYSAHADFINGYRQKSRAMIKNLNVNFDEISDLKKLKEIFLNGGTVNSNLITKLQLRSRQLNNLAVIELCEGNVNRALLSFSKAYSHLKFFDLKNKKNQINLAEQISSPNPKAKDIINISKAEKKTGTAVAYNFAICCLFSGRYQTAFKILTEKVVLVYPTSPRVWWRIAHCCIAAHQEAVKNHCTFEKRQLYKLPNKYLVKLSSTDYSNVRSENNEMSLEYAAAAIRNCLRLLVRYEANMSSNQRDTEDIRMSCKPGNPLTYAGHSELKMHALLAGSYIHLQLENWLQAVEYAKRVIDKEIDYSTDNYYLCWLCYIYQATAYMNSGNTKKGVQLLYEAISLGMDKKNFQSWQSKLYDNTGVSNNFGIGVEGGQIAAQNIKKYGTLSGEAAIISDINEWRLLNMTNLAAAYCLQGKIKQSVGILEKAAEFLSRNALGKKGGFLSNSGVSGLKANGNSLGQQQYDSVRSYICRTLDKDGG